MKIFRWNCPHHFHDIKCALRLIEQTREWLKANNKYRILLTGKMGTGKTTLIKGLTESYIPEADNLLPHTLSVTPHGYEHEGINFVFFDTPGLKDNVDSSNDHEYLKEMVKKNDEPNLLIFAVKMDDSVFRDEDVDAIGNISNAFGWKIWKNAMFILTFANMVTKVGHAPESVNSKLHFSNTYNTHFYHISEALRSNKVQDDVINSISVVPVGLLSQPKIPSDQRDISWVDEFWEKALKVLRTPKRTYDKVEANLDSHKNNDEEEESEFSSYLPLQEKESKQFKIPDTEMEKNAMWEYFQIPVKLLVIGILLLLFIALVLTGVIVFLFPIFLFLVLVLWCTKVI